MPIATARAAAAAAFAAAWAFPHFAILHNAGGAIVLACFAAFFAMLTVRSPYDDFAAKTVLPTIAALFAFSRPLNLLAVVGVEAATEAARLYHMDCVTVAGEKVGKRGAMRGGYFDSRSSRLRLWRGVSAKEAEAKAKQEAVAANQEKLEAIHQVVLSVRREA